MATSLGNTQHNEFNNPGGARTFSFNNDSDKLVVFLFTLLRNTSFAPSVSTLTYNGVACTQAISRNNDNESASIWYLANPATGSNTVNPDYNNTSDISISVDSVSVLGADANNPINATDSVRSTGVSSAAHALTSALGGSMSIDVYSVDAGSDRAMAPDGSQTELSEGYNAGHDHNFAVSYEAEKTAMGYSWGASANVSACAVNIRAPGGGTQAIIIASKIHDFLGELKAGLLPPDELRARYGELMTI